MSDHTSTTHPDDGRLLALMDGELSGEAADGVRGHLARCGACRRKRDELRRASRTLREGLRALDAAPPERDATSVRPAAGADGGPAPHPGEGAPAEGGGGAAPGRRKAGDGAAPGGHRRNAAGSRTGRRPAGRWAAWKAAALVFGVVAGASAAIPGSPVRAWIAASARAVAAAIGAADEPGRPGPAAAPGSSGLQEISVAAAGRAVVDVTDPGPGLRLRVRTSGGEFLSVAGREARYRAGEGRVEVAGAVGPELRIVLPADGPARITVDGSTVLEKRGDRLTVLASSADTTADGLVIPLGPARR